MRSRAAEEGRRQNKTKRRKKGCSGLSIYLSVSVGQSVRSPYPFFFSCIKKRSHNWIDGDIGHQNINFAKLLYCLWLLGNEEEEERKGGGEEKRRRGKEGKERKRERGKEAKERGENE
jgi:hypothetical protein